MGISKGCHVTVEQEGVVGGEEQRRATAETLQGRTGLTIYACDSEDLVSLSTSTVVKKVSHVLSKGEENTKETPEE